MYQLSDEIRKLIAQNKIEEAFELLSSIQLSKTDKELIVLNSQYNRIKEELMLNLISKDEGERRLNQINMALLELSTRIKPASEEQAAPLGGKPLAISTAKNIDPRLWYLLLLIPVFLGIFWIVSFGTTKTSQKSMVAGAKTPETFFIPQDSILYNIIAHKDINQILQLPPEDSTHLFIATSKLNGSVLEQKFSFTPAGDDKVYLSSPHSPNLVVQVNGDTLFDQATVTLAPKQDIDEQKFRAISNGNNQVSFFVEVHGKRYFLTLYNAPDKVILGAHSSIRNGYFTLKPAEPFILLQNYSLVPKAFPSRRMDVERNRTENNTNVILYKASLNNNQQFRFLPAGDGWYYLETALKPDRVLDVQDAKTADGTNIHIEKKKSGSDARAQLFRVIEQPNGYVLLSSRLKDGNAFLGTSDIGNNVVLRTRSVSELGDNVLFRLLPVSQ